MSSKCKHDDDQSNKKEKKVTRKRTGFLTSNKSVNNTKAKGKQKKNKALPRVKYSIVAQMASVEKEMMDEYIEKEEREKNSNASLKEKNK